MLIALNIYEVHRGTTKRNLENNPSKRGEKHPLWKGGITIHEGYAYVKSGKDLPKWNGYIKRVKLLKVNTRN